MKKSKTLLFCLLFLTISTITNAQIWKKIQKKLEKKLERKVEEKIDKETDKIIDDTLNGKEKKETSTRKKKNTLNDSLQFNAKIKIPKTFSFTASLEVKISNNGETEADMEFLIGQYPDIYGLSIASKDMGDGNKVYNVFTPETITMFMEVNGMKIKKSASQKQFSKTDFSDKVPTNANDFKKTGASKSILGYTCYEYKYINQTDSSSIWVTQDFPVKETYIGMLGMGKNNGLGGFVLEVTLKSGKDTTNMRAVKFNEKKNITINTNEYNSLGF
ncbi:DUF4412 domain-containing protein [uncultured Polaribacter sp.]|uniref:DUF4412 domain-containing protein n=1 Tax=uncultured Polaribacter sp. TaxID=174711 RepID=UPI00262CB91C|nr:DUF4412 domain-containing protein [uncultured Polaribacter sp.]